MVINEKKMVKELQTIRHFSYNRFKKRKNESDRDYIIRMAGYRCSYCRLQFPKEKLSVVKKNPYGSVSKMKNGICACRSCANEKGGMGDKEYRNYLSKKKKEMRKEMMENYIEIREKVFSKYHYTCIYCLFKNPNYRKKEHTKLTIDHKVPISRGGTNDLKNLCCACEECNFEKKDMTAEEYFDYLKKDNVSQS